MYNSCIQELKQINILRVLTLFEKNTTFFYKDYFENGAGERNNFILT